MLVRKLLHLRNKTKNDHTAQAVEDDFDNTECDTEGFFFSFLTDRIYLSTFVGFDFFGFFVLAEVCVWPRESRFEDNKGEAVVVDPSANVSTF